jgi:hypothetical protein
MSALAVVLIILTCVGFLWVFVFLVQIAFGEYADEAAIVATMVAAAGIALTAFTLGCMYVIYLIATHVH